MALGPRRSQLGLSVSVAEALDPGHWRRTYAYGLPAGRDPEDPAWKKQADSVFKGFPDDIIQSHLRAAVSEAEIKIGMSLGIEIVKGDEVDSNLRPGVDYDRTMRRLPYTRSAADQRFYRIDIPDNVISVSRVRAYMWRQLAWEFNQETGDDPGAIRIERHNPGSIHIMPLTFTGTLLMPGGGYGFFWQVLGKHTWVPDVWSVDYIAGPMHHGQPGKIPAILAHWVGCRAGILLLSIAGLGQSKGLTSASISMDGVSKSIGLQASAIYGINSALENALKEAEKRINWTDLRRHFRGISMRVW